MITRQNKTTTRETSIVVRKKVFDDAGHLVATMTAHFNGRFPLGRYEMAVHDQVRFEENEAEIRQIHAAFLSAPVDLPKTETKTEGDSLSDEIIVMEG